MAGPGVFLAFTVPGDRVRAEIGARRGAGYEVRVVERIAAGPRHVEPVCCHFGRRGGCALQHLDADDYRAVKLGALHTALQRVGIDPTVVAPLRGAAWASAQAARSVAAPRPECAGAGRVSRAVPARSG